MPKVTFQFSLRVIIDHTQRSFNMYQSETENAPSDPWMGLF